MTLMDPMLTLRTKTCVTCKQTKPWGEFFAQQRWEDGTMRRPRSMCKECDRTRRRLNQRKVRAELRRDPDRFEEYMAKQREYNATYRRKVGKCPQPAKLRIVAPVDTEDNVLLPAGPLVVAIDKASRLEGRFHDNPEARILTRCGIDPRRYYAWRNEAARCSIDYVDRVLIGLGLLWWEVYPPGEFPEVARVFDVLPDDEVAA